MRSFQFRQEGVEELGEEEPAIEDKTNCEVSGSPDEGGVVEGDQLVGESTGDGHGDRSVHHVSQSQDIVDFETGDVVGEVAVPVIEGLSLLLGPFPALRLG